MHLLVASAGTLLHQREIIFPEQIAASIASWVIFNTDFHIRRIVTGASESVASLFGSLLLEHSGG